LQATQDPDIFALGDCASCPQPHLEKPAPPRAQTANQQAKFLAHALPKYIRNETLPHFYYRDYGSLITLSRMKTIGFLRATQRQSGFRLEGYLARFFYWGLHKKHQALILGYWPVIWQIVGNLFKRHDKRPNLKLH
jgi:NADH dehydrogenase